MANKLEKMLFMTRKLLRDIRRDRQIYQLTSDLHSSQLGEYYFLITEKQMLSGHSQQFHFDEEGIPIIPTYIDVAEKKMVYYPISIGQYGLAIWHTYLKSQSDDDQKRFLKIAEWFVNNRIEDDKLGAYWLTRVDKPAYGIRWPWKSAFSQARAINILLRAFQITGNAEFEINSQKALQPFLYSVPEGGITTFTQAGPFYEEYPANVPVLVLNGMIFSLCGIYDFVRTHPNHEAAWNIFNKGISTLETLLPEYDIGFWSKYSLCEADFHPGIDPSTIGYHYLHTVQLELMFQLTQKDIFKDYADKWEKYVKPFNILRMYKMKYSALKKMNRL